ESAIVMETALVQFGGVFLAQPNADAVADAARELAIGVENLAGEVQLGDLARSFLGQGDTRSGNLDRDGNEILILGYPEVIHFERQVQIGERISHGQRIGELPLLVRGVEMLELLG